MIAHFPDDRYETAEETHISLFNRLTCGWRWSLYFEYAGVVFEARRQAVQGKYDDSAWVESSYRVLRAIERNRGRFDIVGINRLREISSGAPYVFISNHMSTLETQVLPCLIAPFMRVTFVVKKGLTTNLIFGPVMRSRDPIAVGRKNPREDLETVLTNGKELLSNGVSIVVFPQSTRTPVFSREGFNSLGIKLAARAGVPVVPVAVKTDFWSEKALLRGFGRIWPERTIHFEFGDPITVNGRGRDEHQAVMDFIELRQEQWRSPQTSAGL
ncbi:MAG TPA: lysophospholipid acyltransferase family protein [Spirochaetia bacterium]|nr:lysophospholipid acyltransferase family protein [Spirochaetia bacterium]